MPAPPIQLVEWAAEPTSVGSFTNLREAETWVRRLRQVEGQIRGQWKAILGDSLFAAEIEHRPAQLPIVRLRARHVSGWLSIEGRLLAILPKFVQIGSPEASGELFARLLEYSRSPRFQIYDWVPGEEGRYTPTDLLARGFLRALEAALAHGPPCGYSVFETEATLLRGRLQTTRVYPNALVRPHLIAQEMSEFTVDIPLSRLLRWASFTLSQLVRDALLRARLEDGAARLADAPPIPPPWHVVEHLRLTPALAHFQPALELARLLAKGRLLAPGTEGPEAPGFIFLSWHVFQEYAGRLLQEALRLLPAGWSIARQKVPLGIPIRGDRRLSCEPDFVVYEGSRPIASLDAKYKFPLGPDELPDEGSVYQVLAAARAVGAPRAVLLQPREIGYELGFQRSWRVCGRGDPELLEMLFIQPATLRSRLEHKGEVRRLAEALRGMA